MTKEVAFPPNFEQVQAELVEIILNDLLAAIKTLPTNCSLLIEIDPTFKLSILLDQTDLGPSQDEVVKAAIDTLPDVFIYPIDLEELASDQLSFTLRYRGGALELIPKILDAILGRLQQSLGDGYTFEKYSGASVTSRCYDGVKVKPKKNELD